ncbi:hypothetical protein [Actinacidiphila sp. bgisy160]|uniref:hypothetical protein n=1 Tax=Actinacidiphila sp. bgisy160 TaxID=3413796 RepID=UPI003D7472B6
MLHRLTAAARRALMRAAALLARLSGQPDPHAAVKAVMYRIGNPGITDTDLLDSIQDVMSRFGFKAPREEDFGPCEGCRWYFLPAELDADGLCEECAPMEHADVAAARR